MYAYLWGGANIVLRRSLLEAISPSGEWSGRCNDAEITRGLRFPAHWIVFYALQCTDKSCRWTQPPAIFSLRLLSDDCASEQLECWFEQDALPSMHCVSSLALRELNDTKTYTTIQRQRHLERPCSSHQHRRVVSAVGRMTRKCRLWFRCVGPTIVYALGPWCGR